MKVAVHRGKCCAFGRSRHLLLENWSLIVGGNLKKYWRETSNPGRVEMLHYI